MPFPKRSLSSLVRSLLLAIVVGIAPAIVVGIAAAIVVGIAAGVGSAIFLHGLDSATDFRETHPWLLFGLPLAGLLIGWFYDRYGREITGGTTLVLATMRGDDDHARMRGDGDRAIPWSMAPAIVAATIVTHLFGGSAGREGTAVQMGGGLADTLASRMRLAPKLRRVVLASGVAGGFGAVFGTPLAGVVFALELFPRGTQRLAAILPCLVAALVGDRICQTLGVTHAAYRVETINDIAAATAWGAIAGIGFGATSFAFVMANSAIAAWVNKRIATPWLRPFFGGLALIGLTFAAGSYDYLGLSLPLIDRAFGAEEILPLAFAIKLAFTAVTLGTGFKGGEVTPLFCIGATLGNTLASIFGQPHDLFAALGLVAVFAGAAKTPWACVVMGIELFGITLTLPLVAACLVSHLVSGAQGIYSSGGIYSHGPPTQGGHAETIDPSADPSNDPSPSSVAGDTMR